MRKEIVKIEVEATCLSCRKSYMSELEDEKVYCDVNGEEVEKDFDCSGWDCNFDIFNFCGFEVKGLELPSLFDCKT